MSSDTTYSGSGEDPGPLELPPDAWTPAMMAARGPEPGDAVINPAVTSKPMRPISEEEQEKWERDLVAPTFYEPVEPGSEESESAAAIRMACDRWRAAIREAATHQSVPTVDPAEGVAAPSQLGDMSGRAPTSVRPPEQGHPVVWDEATVERAARAAREAYFGFDEWETCSLGQKPRWLRVARDALAAAAPSPHTTPKGRCG